MEIELQATTLTKRHLASILEANEFGIRDVHQCQRSASRYWRDKSISTYVFRICRVLLKYQYFQDNLPQLGAVLYEFYMTHQANPAKRYIAEPRVAGILDKVLESSTPKVPAQQL